MHPGAERAPPQRRYEEYAYVLDFRARGRSVTVRGREGVILTTIGEDRLTLLEVLGADKSVFEVGERVFIGKEGREKVQSVLGKMTYDRISDSAKSDLPTIVERIVRTNEKRFVDYINTAQPLTPRIHALELIPGIGKTYLQIMIEERETNRFKSFDDMEERVGFKDPARHIAQRIIEEVTGQTRISIFAKR